MGKSNFPTASGRLGLFPFGIGALTLFHPHNKKISHTTLANCIHNHTAPDPSGRKNSPAGFGNTKPTEPLTRYRIFPSYTVRKGPDFSTVTHSFSMIIPSGKAISPTRFLYF